MTRRGSCLTAVLAAAWACTPSFTAPTPATLAAVRVQYASALGDVDVGRAYVVDTDRAWEHVSTATAWLSSDAAVIRPEIDPPGRFVAVGPGAADVIGTYEGFSDALRIVVRPHPPALPHFDIVRRAAPGRIGSSDTAQAVLRQSRESVQVVTNATWRTSDPHVATVENGHVTTRGIGTVELWLQRTVGPFRRPRGRLRTIGRDPTVLGDVRTALSESRRAPARKCARDGASTTLPEELHDSVSRGARVWRHGRSARCSC